MSRFDYDGDGMPWGLWEATVSRALGGRRGQQALAELETALLELPEPSLIEGHLAYGGATCAVGALVAHRRAQQEGVDIGAAIETISGGVECGLCGHGRGQHEGSGCNGRHSQDRPCSCTMFDPSESEDIWQTVDAGQRVGLMQTVAWHLAYLNDEQFAGATPEQRYRLVLEWVRRAQGKSPDGQRISTAAS